MVQALVDGFESALRKADGRFDKSAQIITVTCNSGIALEVAFDGKFTAEDNFIDLLEGKTRTIFLNPRDVFDGITVYCYNAPKLTVK